MQYRPPKSEPGAGGVLSRPPWPGAGSQAPLPTPGWGVLQGKLPPLAKGSSEDSYWVGFCSLSWRSQN